ncbi:MAG: hypothetical protein MUC29_06530, partial [Pyrinomonadaceae bacterium]|nr:hypothetical protein [Pyrinomonadaceae bacterium]
VSLSLSIFAQETKKEDSTMKNAEVVELVKSGLSEGIIIAKIKGSKTEFDTSSTALVKLKELGVSDNLILAMIEAKPKVEESKEPAKPEAQKTADMKEAVGKRKVYIIAEDADARIEIFKKLTSKGFTIVDEQKLAELIVEVSYAEAITKNKSGVLRTGNDTEYQTKIGKLIVKLNRDSIQYLVYAEEYPYSRAVNTMAIFNVSAAPPSLKDQLKHYLIDDFLKKMKKAGDKIK